MAGWLSMKKIIFVGLLLATLGSAIGASSLIPGAIADRPGDDDPDRNLFSQEAKKLAQSDDGMREHASDPDNDGDKGNDPGEHRVGIGNVCEEALGQGKLHPSEVAECLADGDTDCPP